MKSMKSILPLIATALALGAFDTLGQAPAGGPPGQGGPQRGGPRMQQPLIKALDANGDGKIDATELSNAATALATLDANKDGKLTSDEYQPARPAGGPAAGSAGDRPAFRSPLVTALDVNNDGTIAADELANATVALKKLDKNGDGALTMEELRGPRPGGDGSGQRQRPPGSTE